MVGDGLAGMSPRRWRLKGRVALVTGAGSGIGRACALAAAEEGASVACVDIDGDGAVGTVDLVRARAGSGVAITADVTSSTQVEGAVATVRTELGGIDLLVNCAGGGVHGSVHELSDEAWDRCIALNLTATFYCCRAVVPDMLDGGAGVIVNLCSSLAMGAPRFAAYTAAKAAVRGLTVQMARDYSPAIRVNSVSPAAIDTPGLRRGIASKPDPAAFEAELVAANKLMRRLGSVDEVASAVLFAATDDSSFMTGQDIVVCGGQTVAAY